MLFAQSLVHSKYFRSLLDFGLKAQSIGPIFKYHVMMFKLLTAEIEFIVYNISVRKIKHSSRIKDSDTNYTLELQLAFCIHFYKILSHHLIQD